jgi:predicted Zn-dependent protease
VELVDRQMQYIVSKSNRWAVVMAAAAVLGGCVVNPVTGERELALVSAADEVAIGEAQYAPSRQMQGGDYVIDPALTRYVASVGQRLAAVSDRALPYEFVVLNPGGKIAINRGLLMELGSEAELAAVLGHEIVHAAARHGALAMQRGMLLQTAVLATAAATGRGDYSGIAVGAATLGAQLINQRNGREAELESDYYGMVYMSRAGYDPQAAVTLQETFLSQVMTRRLPLRCRKRFCGCRRIARSKDGSQDCLPAIRPQPNGLRRIAQQLQHYLPVESSVASATRQRSLR